MENKLKECPFCGGEAHMVKYVEGSWCISCLECSTEQYWTEDESKAIKAWNTRHPEKKDINTNPNPNTPNGSGHSGPCQEGCQCDIARAFSAPSPRYSDKQLDAIVDKIRESDSPYPQIPSNGVEYRRGFIDGIEEYKKKAPSLEDIRQKLLTFRNLELTYGFERVKELAISIRDLMTREE